MNPKVLYALLGYSFCSSTLLVLNKVAVSSVPAPSFVLLLQFITSALVVKILSFQGYLEADALSWEKVKGFGVIAVIFAMTLFTNVKSLEYANVETVIVFRACSPIAVSIADWYFLGRTLPSTRSWLSLLGIVAGAVMYVMSDSSFRLDAYLWVSGYFVMIVTEMIYTKYIINTIEMSTWGRVYYNNFLACIPMVIFGYLAGDHHALMTQEWTGLQIVALSLACVAGVGISYAGFSLRSLVPAAQYTVIGVCNKFFSILLNVFIWDKHASNFGIGCMFFCIACGIAFQKSKPRDEKKKGSKADKVK